MQSEIKEGFKALFKLFLQCLVLEPNKFPIWKFNHKSKELKKALDFMPGSISPDVLSLLKTVAFSHTVAAVPFSARHKFNWQHITPYSESAMLYMRRAIFSGLECENYEQALTKLINDLEEKSSILARRFVDCKPSTLDVITMQKSICAMLYLAYLTNITLTEALPDSAIEEFMHVYHAGCKRMTTYIDSNGHGNTAPLEMAIGMLKAQAHE